MNILGLGTMDFIYVHIAMSLVITFFSMWLHGDLDKDHQRSKNLISTSALFWLSMLWSLTLVVIVLPLLLYGIALGVSRVLKKGVLTYPFIQLYTLAKRILPQKNRAATPSQVLRVDTTEQKELASLYGQRDQIDAKIREAEAKIETEGKSVFRDLGKQSSS